MLCSYAYAYVRIKKVPVTAQSWKGGGVLPRARKDSGPALDFSSLTGRVKWYHNDCETDETSMERYFKMNLSDIGNFTCKISNAFGEITRTFNINPPISQECILNVENDLNGQQPFILTNRKQWYLLQSIEGSIITPKLRRVHFFCPGNYVTDKTSSFTEQVTATCIENSKFKIHSKIVDFKDLKCFEENKPLAKLNGPDCGLATENTELFTVGFNIRTEFLGV
ncbi:unnamed protein product, partial [Brenthis ino]